MFQLNSQSEFLRELPSEAHLVLSSLLADFVKKT